MLACGKKVTISRSVSFIATGRRGGNIGTTVAFDSGRRPALARERTVTDIAAQVRDILVFHLGADERRLSDETRLAEDLGADSLDIVEIVMSCEERFGIDVPTRVARRLATVGDAVRHVEAALAATEAEPPPARRPLLLRFASR
jgi:acyl carrier protein